MTRIRTAIIASRIFEPEGAAAAYRLGALRHALEKNGIRTKVLTSRPPGRFEREAAVRRWPVLRDRTGAVRGYVQFASFDIPLIFRLLFSPRADIVIVEPPPTTGVVARVVCGLKRMPYVYFSADVSATAAAGIGVSPFVVRVLRSVERWVLRGAAGILTVSPGVHDEVLALDVEPARVTMVGTGIDVSTFTEAGRREGGTRFLVYAGTMSEIQGASVFIEAFGELLRTRPQARLLMFGDGTEQRELSRRAIELAGDRVRFFGTVDSETLVPWLRGASAGLASVRPGRGYDFAYATKALATVSCGTPVIYSGVGPVRSMVDDNGLGWAVDWDVSAVASAMGEALDQNRGESERSRLASWVRQNHSLETVSERAVSAILGAAAST